MREMREREKAKRAVAADMLCGFSTAVQDV